MALFCNVKKPCLLPGYSDISPHEALEWLDEGKESCNPPISFFLSRYWAKVSMGNLSFGLNTPREVGQGLPIVPELMYGGGGKIEPWIDLVRTYLEGFAEQVWIAAGRLKKKNRRWIPSIILVIRFENPARTLLEGWKAKYNGKEYLIGDVSCINYTMPNLCVASDFTKGRKWWGTLCHLYAHNFLEFSDLTHPTASLGYWDVLGDCSQPAKMSDICSVIKERVGWTAFTHVVSGPQLEPPVTFELRPYSLSGESVKIIPDESIPTEYFVLEYRKCSGPELWDPDAALTTKRPEGGLLILHIDERIGLSPLTSSRLSPFISIVNADVDASGANIDWISPTQEDFYKTLFPTTPSNASLPADSGRALTPATIPSSAFHGGRYSGLCIWDIQTIANSVIQFTIGISGGSVKAWKLSEKDLSVRGTFLDNSANKNYNPHQIYIRNDTKSAILDVFDNQVFCRGLPQENQMNLWPISASDKFVQVADFDGDGLDELFVVSAEKSIAILKVDPDFGTGFRTLVCQFKTIGSWTLHPDDRFVMGNFSGQQNRAELAVYNCKTAMMCLLEMRYGRLMTLGKLHDKNIDDWPLSNTSLAKSGRFMPLQRDQLLVQFISPTPAFALLDFDSGRWRRLCVNMNRVDNFMLSREDCTLIGKFDPTAPDTDFIFVYSPTSMSLMAWSTSSQQLSCLWQTDAAHFEIPHISDPSQSLTLSPKSRYWCTMGRFRYESDAIFLCYSNCCALLALDSSTQRFVVLSKIPLSSPIVPLPDFPLRDPQFFLNGLPIRTQQSIASFHVQFDHLHSAASSTSFTLLPLDSLFLHSSSHSAVISFEQKNPLISSFALSWLSENILLQL